MRTAAVILGFAGAMLFASCQTAQTTPTAPENQPEPAKAAQVPTKPDNTAAEVSNCMPQQSIDAILPKMVKTIDQFRPGNAGDNKDQKPALKTDQCWKRVYTYKAYSLVFYTNPNDPKREPQANIIETDKIPKNPDQCWKQATKDIHNLGLNFADKVLENFRKDSEWLWNDGELGPVTYVKCDKHAGEYLKSLSTVVHELIHKTQKDSCLDAPYHEGALCFKISDKAPPRAVAKLEHLPLADETTTNVYKKLNDGYSEAVQEGPIIMLDELNAYTASTYMNTALLRKYGKGKNGLFEKNKDRPVSVLPLFLFYTVEYVAVVKNKYPELYRKEFAPGTENHKQLMSMLSEGELAYKAWAETLKSVREHETSGEKAIWALYLKTKRSI